MKKPILLTVGSLILLGSLLPCAFPRDAMAGNGESSTDADEESTPDPTPSPDSDEIESGT